MKSDSDTAPKAVRPNIIAESVVTDGLWVNRAEEETADLAGEEHVEAIEGAVEKAKYVKKR